jgi:hypothetical protein
VKRMLCVLVSATLVTRPGVAWALPVPVSDRLLKGLYKAYIANFST